MINQSVVVTKFLEWYKSDPHSANEDFYSDTFTFEYLSQLPKDEFIDYFYNFAGDGGKIQSGGERTKNKFRENIEENYEEFRHNILEIFSKQFDVEKWIGWAEKFKYLGQGLATIILNRKDKNTYAIVNDKSIDGLNALGYPIKKSGSLYQKYLVISNAEKDFMDRFPELENYYIIDSLMHYIIGTEEGSRFLKNMGFEVIEKKSDVILQLLANYKVRLRKTGLGDEIYKWKNLYQYAGRPDLSKENLSEEFRTIKFDNLLYQNANTVFKNLSKNKSEEYRHLLNFLFDETLPLSERILKFTHDIALLFQEMESDKNLFHNHEERTIATLLTYHNPEKYTFYKSSFYGKYCKLLGIKPKNAGEKYVHYLELLQDLISGYISKDHELTQLVKSQLTDDCYKDENYLLVAQDILYTQLEKTESGSDQNIEPEIFANNQKMKKHLNQILFGPPGTGKTYHTINESVQIIDPEFYHENSKDRESLRSYYNDKLIIDWETAKGQIGFCTFHQSFSYEDFVEGIKPQKPSDADTYLKYTVEEGIFKRMCKLAERNLKGQNIQNQELISFTEDEFKSAQFYKLSLGDFSEQETKALYNYWKENNVISIGFGDGLDFSGKNETEVTAIYQEKYKDDFGANAINLFKNYLKVGNYVVISKGNLHIRAIGRVTGEYYYDPTTEMRHKHFRTVQWIFNDQEIPVEDLYTKSLAPQTIYKMKSEWIQKSFFVNSSASQISEEQRNYVLIIDEINRGNVASIFGELITLIEPDKRAGNKEELKVVLPYSKDSFTVPSNLYIIGTMNTADRSIEALDTALRRRFSFKEMGPDPALINTEGRLKDSNGTIDDIDVVALLSAINDRIEKLIDKDHKIGHAYFMDIETKDDLDMVFRDKVIPLLEEYFFGDYGKIGLVLGDSFVEQTKNDNFNFANFSAYDGQVSQDLAERYIYKIKSPLQWDFTSVYTNG